MSSRFAIFAPVSLGGFSVFLLTMQMSHYFITALAKGFIGPRPWSWVLHNRMHYLAASAYSWGWARFSSWKSWLQVVSGLKRVEVPLQAVVFALEALSPLGLLGARLAGWLSLLFAAFHVGVFLTSGLLFWDWVLTDLLLAVFYFSLPSGAQASLGGEALLLGLMVMALFPLRHRLWKPMPLGWFDTPLTQRMHYRVVGESGKVYGLYNDFMCPHERLYGKVHGCFLTERPVLTYHLGEVWKLDLRDAIVEAGPSLERLERVKQRFGIVARSALYSVRHQNYLRRFFWELNRGASKSVLPAQLRFLKAPGDQIYYFGSFEAYRRQEPVAEVRIVYREEFFDGANHVLLHEEQVDAIEIPSTRTSVAPLAEPELTPKELDDFLLELAKGRLIDLPRGRERYLHADDGKSPQVAS
jgi:hypothetical protein